MSVLADLLQSVGRFATLGFAQASTGISSLTATDLTVPAGAGTPDRRRAARAALGDSRPSSIAQGCGPAGSPWPSFTALSIGRDVPLGDAVRWLVSLPPAGVIEFLPKSDPMVRRMMRRREDVFDA